MRMESLQDEGIIPLQEFFGWTQLSQVNDIDSPHPLPRSQDFWKALGWGFVTFRFAIEIMGSKVVGDIRKFKQFKEIHRIFDKKNLDLKGKNTV